MLHRDTHLGLSDLNPLWRLTTTHFLPKTENQCITAWRRGVGSKGVGFLGFGWVFLRGQSLLKLRGVKGAFHHTPHILFQGLVALLLGLPCSGWNTYSPAESQKHAGSWAAFLRVVSCKHAVQSLLQRWLHTGPSAAYHEHPSVWFVPFWAKSGCCRWNRVSIPAVWFSVSTVLKCYSKANRSFFRTVVFLNRSAILPYLIFAEHRIWLGCRWIPLLKRVNG